MWRACIQDVHFVIEVLVSLSWQAIVLRGVPVESGRSQRAEQDDAQVSERAL